MNQLHHQERDPLIEDWLTVGTSIAPADRAEAERGAWEAYEAIGARVPQLLMIWVQSPMAGVLASTYLGFALREPLKPRLTAGLEAALARNIFEANDIRQAVDQRVWDVARAAVHRRVADDLHSRDAAWSSMKTDIGNYTWNQVWEEVGDQIYAQYWERDARASEGLFDANLANWPDAMMEGQFGAGSMAALDALGRLGEAPPEGFTGLRRVARSCGWWWAYEAGVVFCERPAALSMSGQNVTVEYRDGWTAST